MKFPGYCAMLAAISLAPAWSPGASRWSPWSSRWSLGSLDPGFVAQTHTNAIIDLWAAGKPAFGVYAPTENQTPRGQAPSPPDAPRRPSYSREGGETLAANPIYDFVFLNLEGGYDGAYVKAIVEGLRASSAVSRKTLIVRIPSIKRDGPEATRDRVRDILAMGADGVTLPQLRGLDDAKLAVSFFSDAKANVWSPKNPRGEIIAMLMLEDPGAIADVKAVADLPGYSILACGIGSLRQALGGDAAGAEAGTQTVLAQAKRAGLADMLTASTRDIEQRVKEGFLALLMSGPTADEAIALGRKAAGR